VDAPVHPFPQQAPTNDMGEVEVGAFLTHLAARETTVDCGRSSIVDVPHHLPFFGC